MVQAKTNILELYSTSQNNFQNLKEIMEDDKGYYTYDKYADNSDSDTSGFEDSDDNEEIIKCMQQLKTDEKNNNMKTLEKNQRFTCSSSRIDILCSPRLARKQCGRSPPDLFHSGSLPRSKSTMLHPSVAMRPIPRSKSISAPTTPTNENKPFRRSPVFLSPNVKRKQIDITKSPAYKEIYAHNLRLYSAVLAKQMASTGQIGREMDEIRRNKIKQKALKNQNEEYDISNCQRSRSFAGGDRKSFHEQVPTRMQRSNSAGSSALHDNISLFLQKNMSQSQNDLCVLMEDLPTENSLKEDNCINNMEPQVEMTPRKKAASLRSEALRRKLNSFDNTLNEANEFLAKVKHIQTATSS